MTNNIGRDDNKASDRFPSKSAVPRIGFIFIYHDQQSFLKKIIPLTDEQHLIADRDFWVMDF